MIGTDLKTLQYGWPLGMPLIRKLSKELWEVRSHLSQKKISRIIFYVEDDAAILLNGFIKKSQKTEKQELVLALERKLNLKRR